MRPELLALALLVWGCDDTPRSAAADSAVDARADAATAPDGAAADGAVPDAGTRLRCACSAQPENCDACLRLIGRCCNGDETFANQLGYLVATCADDPNCAACCDECAGRTCEEVIRAGDCPLQP